MPTEPGDQRFEMEPATHLKIDQGLCGRPLKLSPGYSSVRLQPTPVMRADAADLVHGGFVFGLADYAAMLAVGHPNVVLGAAEVRFVKPVQVGDTLTAEATLRQAESQQENRKLVDVTVARGEETVFIGEFVCFVLDHHVLAKGSEGE